MLGACGYTPAAEECRKIYPIRALRPDKVFLVEDYMDIAMRRDETFMQVYEKELTAADLMPRLTEHWNSTKFFITKALDIRHIIFLPNGSVVFKYQKGTWVAEKTCAIHFDISPCYLCSRKCNVYECH
jgi:hypothetical protein